MKKNSNFFQGRSRQTLHSIVPVTLLWVFGLALPLCNGQVVTGQKTTATQQSTTQKATTPRQLTVNRLSIKPVKVSATELRTITDAMPAKTFSSTQTLTTAQKSAGVQPIVVSTPVNNDIWEAGKEYTISWNGAKNEVRIELVTLSTAGKPIEKHTITSRTANTGTYRFKVPSQWLKETRGHKVVIETIDGKQSGTSQGTITVYTQPVDLECIIVDAKQVEKTTPTLIYNSKEMWLEFNVLMRNKGTQSPVTITKVLFRLIKEPENIVCYMEEWGFSGIYYHEWHRLPEPRKIDVMNLKNYVVYMDKNVNLEEGNYRAEIELDPLNNLNELEELRHDNKYIMKWKIVKDI